MVFKRIFIFILVIWILLSTFDVFYNSFKFISEAKHLLPLSREQKRQETYGNIYTFLKDIEINTSYKSSVLIYSNDDKAYYLGRYILYPRFVSVKNIPYSFDGHVGEFTYIASDKKISVPVNYILISSKSGYFIFKHL